jgi:hypothetical protein
MIFAIQQQVELPSVVDVCRMIVVEQEPKANVFEIKIKNFT